MHVALNRMVAPVRSHEAFVDLAAVHRGSTIGSDLRAGIDHIIGRIRLEAAA